MNRGLIFLTIVIAVATSACGGNGSDLEATIVAQNTQIARLGGETEIASTSNLTPTPSTIPLATEEPSPTTQENTSAGNKFPLKGGEITGSLVSVLFGDADSAREGYRRIGLLFYTQNTSAEPINFEISRNPDSRLAPTYFSSVIPTIVAAGGFEYVCSWPALISGFTVYRSKWLNWLPPGFGLASESTCAAPNTATELTLKLVYAQASPNSASIFTVPLSGNSIDGKLPSLADIGPAFPALGESASLDDMAEISLTSAKYDAANASWEITLQIKNLFGYDVTYPQAHVGVFSDTALYYVFDEFGDQALTPDIPPGLEKTWTLTVGGDASPSTLLFVGLTRAEARASAPHYVVFRLQYPSLTPAPTSTSISEVSGSTPTANPNSIGFMAVAGIWRGIITGLSGEPSSSQTEQAYFEIRPSCQTGTPCLNIMRESGYNSFDAPFDTALHRNPGDFCFTPRPYLFEACFALQADGSLSYQAEGGLYSESGMLQRVSETDFQAQMRLECNSAPAIRLKTGTTARVAFTDGLPLKVRSAPGTNADKVSSIPEGGEVTITDGPYCEDELWWWKVNFPNGSSGWVAEGSGNVYFVEPLP